MVRDREGCRQRIVGRSIPTNMIAASVVPSGKFTDFVVFSSFAPNYLLTIDPSPLQVRNGMDVVEATLRQSTGTLSNGDHSLPDVPDENCPSSTGVGIISVKPEDDSVPPPPQKRPPSRNGHAPTPPTHQPALHAQPRANAPIGSERTDARKQPQSANQRKRRRSRVGAPAVSVGGENQPMGGAQPLSPVNSNAVATATGGTGIGSHVEQQKRKAATAAVAAVVVAASAGKRKRPSSGEVTSPRGSVAAEAKVKEERISSGSSASGWCIF